MSVSIKVVGVDLKSRELYDTMVRRFFEEAGIPIEDEIEYKPVPKDSLETSITITNMPDTEYGHELAEKLQSVLRFARKVEVTFESNEDVL